MLMTPDKNTKPTKLCPTCGTKVNEDAARCLVCGTDLTGTANASRPSKGLRRSRMPELTLSLPAALGLLAMFLVIGSGLTFLATRQTPAVAADTTPTATDAGTATPTPTPTETPTPLPPTSTHTPEPTATPQIYIVKANDGCLSIAGIFGVSVSSIIQENNLSTSCILSIGQELRIPAPTPTATAAPTATLTGADATRAACLMDKYTIQEGQTMSHVVALYNVPAEAIREWNGLVNDTVRVGQILDIPLCRRNANPNDPTPTPTPPPPYEAPSLLLPADGAPFTASDNTVTLQWAALGNLRSNEAYEIIILDVTDSGNRRIVERVTDNKFVVPTSFRPSDSQAHVIRWTVSTVRQVGTDKDGNPLWTSAGAVSAPRTFTWYGSGASATATPRP
jgi:LysM repeat protein